MRVITTNHPDSKRHYEATRGITMCGQSLFISEITHLPANCPDCLRLVAAPLPESVFSSPPRPPMQPVASDEHPVSDPVAAPAEQPGPERPRIGDKKKPDKKPGTKWDKLIDKLPS